MSTIKSDYVLERFFPALRRGHSLGTHGYSVKHARCTEDTCNINNPKSKTHHIDRGANIKDWEEERGMTLESFYNRRDVLANARQELGL